MGSGVVIYLQKDAIIDSVKEKVMSSVMPDLGGDLGDMIPDTTGPAMPTMPKF